MVPVCALAWMAACASAPRPGAVATTAATTQTAECAGLAAVLDGARTDASVLRAMGVELHDAAGERTITGEVATDERVSEVVALGCVGDSALGVVRTDCGNVTLIGFAAHHGEWTPRAHLALVEAGLPGRCVRAVSQVTPVALTTLEPREFAVETEVASDDGDEGSGRTLRLAWLGSAGDLRWYAGTVHLGSFDERTGAATQGRWDVIEELPVPRDLYIEQRPIHGGLAGEPIGSEIRRETWRLQDGALRRVDVTHERVVPPAPLSPAPLPPPPPLSFPKT